MKVSEAIASRFSVRAFRDEPVPRETIESILERAKQSPSGGNLQPWHVHVLGGRSLEAFVAFIDARVPEHPMGEGAQYNVYPPKLKEPYRSRRFKCGEDLYAAIGIPRENKPARLRQFANNYRFFGAPLALFFAMDRTMEVGQWADLGMFMQNIMLLAREEGLHTCPQESWASWYRAVGEFLSLPEELMLFCGMAMGYADESAAINGWRTDRAPGEQFVAWHGL